MKVPNKQEHQRIAFNNSLDINFKDFMNLYRKCTAKLYSFLVIDATLPLDNPASFRKNLLEKIWKLIITIDDKIRDEKLQYDINREAGKISALSSGKIDKYEFLTGEYMLSSNQRQTIEQAKVKYSPFRRAFEKKTKTAEEKIDDITNQNKGLAALTNKDDHKDDHSDIKKYFIK